MGLAKELVEYALINKKTNIKLLDAIIADSSDMARMVMPSELEELKKAIRLVRNDITKDANDGK